jgi:hypothetical protein
VAGSYEHGNENSSLINGLDILTSSAIGGHSSMELVS